MDGCCSTPADQQTQAVPKDKEPFRNHSGTRVNTDVASGVNLARVSCGLSSEHLCCPDITLSSGDCSDRDGAQPTPLNTKPGCVHYSTKHRTRLSAPGTTGSFKEFNQTFPGLIRFPWYRSLNIPFLEKVEVPY